MWLARTKPLAPPRTANVRTTGRRASRRVVQVAQAVAPLAAGAAGAAPVSADADAAAMESLVVLASLVVPDPAALSANGDSSSSHASNSDSGAALSGLEPELAATVAAAFALSLARFQVMPPVTYLPGRCCSLSLIENPQAVSETR